MAISTLCHSNLLYDLLSKHLWQRVERKEAKEIIWHLQLVIQVTPLLSLILARLLHDHAKTAIKCQATKCEYSIPAFPCYHPQTLVQRTARGSHHHYTDTATSGHTTRTYNANANYQTGRNRCVITFN